MNCFVFATNTNDVHVHAYVNYILLSQVLINLSAIYMILPEIV